MLLTVSLVIWQSPGILSPGQLGVCGVQICLKGGFQPPAVPDVPRVKAISRVQPVHLVLHPPGRLAALLSICPIHALQGVKTINLVRSGHHVEELKKLGAGGSLISHHWLLRFALKAVVSTAMMRGGAEDAGAGGRQRYWLFAE